MGYDKEIKMVYILCFIFGVVFGGAVLSMLFTIGFGALIKEGRIKYKNEDGIWYPEE